MATVLCPGNDLSLGGQCHTVAALRARIVGICAAHRGHLCGAPSGDCPRVDLINWGGYGNVAIVAALTRFGIFDSVVFGQKMVI